MQSQSEGAMIVSADQISSLDSDSVVDILFYFILF